MAYLDNTGVGTLWGRIKTYIAGLGFYTKPSTGIPASDIESGVIPTVPTKVSDLTNDAGYTTNTGTVTSTGGTVAVNNIQVVSALPASPDANTLYLIPES